MYTGIAEFCYFFCWFCSLRPIECGLSLVCGCDNQGPVVQRNSVTILSLNQLDLTEGFNAKLVTKFPLPITQKMDCDRHIDA
jgi:hypothetical protein